jgi:hypothetical protein
VALQLTAPDGSALSGLTATAERAVPSDHIAMAVKNLGVTAVVGAKFVLYGEVTPGDWATVGHPSLDERQGRVQITSVDSSGTAGQTSGTVTPQPLGHLSDGVLPDILPGNTIFFDFWVEQASTSAGGGAISLKIAIDEDAAAVPVEYGLSLIGRGIDSGVNLPKSFLIAGRVLTASGSPDDLVHYALGSWLFQGVAGSDGSGGTVTLNQNDVAAAALAAGEGYRAAVSQGSSSTPTVTKGVKASMTGAGPDYPVVPVGEVLLGFVLVLYDAGGGAIATGDITQDDLTYGRYKITTSGLVASVHTGEALIANFRQVRAVKGDVALVAASTNRIWLEYTGAVTVTQTAAQPSPGALLLGTFTTDGSGVTGSTDDRVYIGGAGTLSLHAASHHTGGTDPLTPADIGAASTADLALKADLADPVFTGNPTAPTPTTGDDSTSIATTAFVQDAIVPTFNESYYTSDGSTQPATLSPSPLTNMPIRAFAGGLRLRRGIGLDFVMSGDDLVFAPIPENGTLVCLEWYS